MFHLVLCAATSLHENDRNEMSENGQMWRCFPTVVFCREFQKELLVAEAFRNDEGRASIVQAPSSFCRCVTNSSMKVFACLVLDNSLACSTSSNRRHTKEFCMIQRASQFISKTSQKFGERRSLPGTDPRN